MNTVTHVAGLTIDAPGRTVQRCALCGEKLVDSRGMMVPVGPDGKTSGVGTWPTGRLVQVTVGQNPRRYSLLPEAKELPDDCCLPLVE